MWMIVALSTKQSVMTFPKLFRSQFKIKYARMYPWRIVLMFQGPLARMSPDKHVQMSQGKFVSKSHGNNARLCPDSLRKPGWKMIVRLCRMSHAVKYQGKNVNKSPIR